MILIGWYDKSCLSQASFPSPPSHPIISFDDSFVSVRLIAVFFSQACDIPLRKSLTGSSSDFFSLSEEGKLNLYVKPVQNSVEIAPSLSHWPLDGNSLVRSVVCVCGNVCVGGGE